MIRSSTVMFAGCFALLTLSSLPAFGVVLLDEPVERSDDKPLPSLDELLGLDDGSGNDAADDATGDTKGETKDPAIEDPNRSELEKVLSPRQAGEAFTQAVGLMDQVASRLEDQHDLSLITQRLQEDILIKLDQVIESAKKNNSGSGGKSSSSQQSSSSNQDQPNQQQQDAQQGQGNQSASDSGQEQMPAGASDAQPGDEIAPDGVRWGALPKRIRDALSQGIADEYSALYRRITEQYYRSLADDE